MMRLQRATTQVPETASPARRQQRCIRRTATPSRKVGIGTLDPSGTYVDMIKAGIIDPAKVVRLALQGAASIAGLLIATEAMVADKPAKGAQAMPGVGMSGTVY